MGVVALLTVSCGKVTNYKISGELKGFEDQKVYLMDAQTSAMIDSAEVKNGKFVMKGDVKIASIVHVLFDKVKEVSIPIILEQGNIEVFSDRDAIGVFDVKGTKSNVAFAQYNNSLREISQRYVALVGEFQAAEGDETVLDSLRKKVDELLAEKTQISSDLVQNNKDTYAAAYILSQTETYGFASSQMDSLINMLSEMPENVFLNAMKERRDALALVDVGKPAPDFTLPTPDGQTISLSSLKGKVVVIDFWASWCGPCRAENPNMLKIYEKYKDADFTILGVSIDQDQNAWKEAIAQDKLIWNQVIAQSKEGEKTVADQYGVVAIPHTVIIDKQGVIAGTVLFGDELEAKVTELLNQ